MTPALIIFFGMPPVVASATDLVFDPLPSLLHLLSIQGQVLLIGLLPNGSGGGFIGFAVATTSLGAGAMGFKIVILGSPVSLWVLIQSTR